jgi:hypothetical protein
VNRPPSIKGVERQAWPQIARRTAAASAEAPRCAIVGRGCPGTRIGRSSENVPSETVWKLRISSLLGSTSAQDGAKKRYFAALGVIEYTRSRAF